MAAKKPLVRTSSGPGLTEVQLVSSDLSDGPFLPEAPNDGLQYARQRLGWTVVSAGGISQLDGGQANAVYGGVTGFNAGGAT